MRCFPQRYVVLLALPMLLLVGCASAPSQTGAARASVSQHRASRHHAAHHRARRHPHRAHARTHRTHTRPATGTALAALGTLPIKGRAPMTGYSRAAFGAAWSDDNDEPDGHNGCDTRNDVLRRDLVAIALKPGSSGCAVASGVLHDPYTGHTIHFVRGIGTSEAVQIDHMVALGDAWQTGAQRWTERRRQDLANDPLELLAVDGPTNEAKGDGDAATWLPPRHAFRCRYVARQVAIKKRWGLWVTPAEHDAIARVLSACPGQRLPSEGDAPGPATLVRRPPRVHHHAPPPVAHPHSMVVHPGAFCAPRGAHGVTDKGTAMVCGPASDGRNRWISAH